jgi:formylglycine-generating enzyme required for sulfatase activity
MLSGLSFAAIPAGSLTSNNNKTINEFLICEEPIPLSLYDFFLNENQKWKDEYINYYEEEISVPLSDVYTGIITGISWYSANAFCGWLTERLPAGMQARLPAEMEWEYAAMFGINNTENQIWEWCADPYTPIQFINAPAAAIEAVGSPQRSLRGKNTRASLPPGFSSPFVTLRPVITQITVQ